MPYSIDAWTDSLHAAYYRDEDDEREPDWYDPEAELEPEDLD